MAAQGAPLLARVVGYSVAIANNAGKIIREIMKKGELGIVEKEAGLLSWFMLTRDHFCTQLHVIHLFSW